MAILKLKINNTDLIEEVNLSVLAAALTAGVSSISVESIANFAINQVLLIGNVGQEKTEIIKTHASTDLLKEIAGEGQSWKSEFFTSDPLKDITRIKVETVNPQTKSADQP